MHLYKCASSRGKGWKRGYGYRGLLRKRSPLLYFFGLVPPPIVGYIPLFIPKTPISFLRIVFGHFISLGLCCFRFNVGCFARLGNVHAMRLCQPRAYFRIGLTGRYLNNLRGRGQEIEEFTRIRDGLHERLNLGISHWRSIVFTP